MLSTIRATCLHNARRYLHAPPKFTPNYAGPDPPEAISDLEWEIRTGRARPASVREVL